MKDKEGAEVEIKFVDCNWRPKLLTELQEKLKQWYDHIQKNGETATRQGIRITLKEREIWDNTNQDGSAKC